MAVNINGTGSITGLSSISSPTISGGSLPAGTASAPGITFSGDSNTGIYSPGADKVAITTSGTERLIVDDTGKVGIGTTSVNTTLEVQNASTPIVRVGDGTRHMELRGGSTTQNAAIGTNYGGGFDIIQNGSAAVTIDTSKRVLVGTSSGSDNNALLKVQGNVGGATGVGWIDVRRGVAIPGADGMLGYISISDSSGNIYAAIEGYQDAAGGTNDYPGRLVFSTTTDGASSPTTRLTIKSNGTSVFSSAPDTTISRSAGGSPGILVNSSSGSTSAGFEATTDSTSTRYCATFSIATSIVGTITTSGSSTAYNTSSDYRLKENVVPLTNAADRLNQLQVHRFNFIADPDKTVDGFLAHEAQAVVPECVTGTKDEVDADGNPVYQGIDQSKLVPLLTAALQEAIGRIETLEAEVAALKAS